MSVESNTRTFTEGHKAKIRGVILSHDGDTLKLRGDDNSIGTIDLTDKTKVELKQGIFREKTALKTDALVPGLEVEALGKGAENGDLVAGKVVFDRDSLKVSRQVAAQVDPVAGRAGALEGRAGALENRAGQLEDQQGKLDERQNQTAQQVSQVNDHVRRVQTEADQANQGVESLNQRVTNLDTYQEKYSAVLYFNVNSSKLTREDKQKLDNLAQQAKGEKGYSIQIAGYADKSGSTAHNQFLSESRADSVIHYLQQQGDVPINRILAPAGLGTTHEAADNRTRAGRKLNRRVEVKVLVNEGLSGDSKVAANANQSDENVAAMVSALLAFKP
jgi:outer membrane protein OmpA-like peptidoglycan-associated protein